MKRKKTAATLMIAVSALMTLSACSPDIRQVDGNDGPVSGGQSDGSMSGEEGPTLDEDRIRRIVSDVQKVLDETQETKNTDALKERLTAAALTMRTGQFVRAAKTGTDLEPLVIDVNVASATVSRSWPRVLLVGSASAANDPAEVFIFTQSGPQDKYFLQNWVRAVGGNSVRGVAVEEGTKALASDAAGFRYQPGEVRTLFVNALNSPDNPEYRVFDDKTFTPRYEEDRKGLSEAVAAAGSVITEATPSDYPVTTVTLATGEALVATSFEYTHVYHRTVPNSSMSVGGTAAAFLDDPNVVGTVTVKYLVNIVFTVPPEDSTDLVRVIGSERVIIDVSRDDAAIPEGE